MSESVKTYLTLIAVKALGMTTPLIEGTAASGKRHKALEETFPQAG